MQRLRRRFSHEQRDDRRRVPESHRPARRPSSNLRTPETAPLSRGGLVVKTTFDVTPRAGRTIPSRTRRASRPSLSGRSSLTGSRRATGRPRSMIRTGEPPLTLSISALRLCLAPRRVLATDPRVRTTGTGAWDSNWLCRGQRLENTGVRPGSCVRVIRPSDEAIEIELRQFTKAE